MRNNIDRETYTWLFKILGFFAFLLVIINGLIIFSPETFSGYPEKTANFASATLFLVLAVSIWIRLEYLKSYNFSIYKTRKFPLWTSAIGSVFLAIYRMF